MESSGWDGMINYKDAVDKQNGIVQKYGEGHLKAKDTNNKPDFRWKENIQTLSGNIGKNFQMLLRFILILSYLEEILL